MYHKETNGSKTLSSGKKVARDSCTVSQFEFCRCLLPSWKGQVCITTEPYSTALTKRFSVYIGMQENILILTNLNEKLFIPVLASVLFQVMKKPVSFFFSLSFILSVERCMLSLSSVCGRVRACVCVFSEWETCVQSKLLAIKMETF